jgi:hypothetical protein
VKAVASPAVASITGDAEYMYAFANAMLCPLNCSYSLKKPCYVSVKISLIPLLLLSELPLVASTTSRAAVNAEPAAGAATAATVAVTGAGGVLVRERSLLFVTQASLCRSHRSTLGGRLLP